MCHQMSDSAMPRPQYAKMAPASRNMHITGNEKKVATNPGRGLAPLVCTAAIFSARGAWHVIFESSNVSSAQAAIGQLSTA